MASASRIFDDLENFKGFMQTSVKERCKKKYDLNTYNTHIAPLIDNMLEDLEVSIESIGEQSIQEDDLNYDNTLEGE